MSNSSSAAKAPVLPHHNWDEQFRVLYQSSSEWIATHWLQIAIAVAIAAGIASALIWARSLGPRLASRSSSGKGWPAVFGRAIQRTGTLFIILLAAKLVSGFADAPWPVARTINVLFGVAAIFQSAAWAREVIIGAIERRTRSDAYSGEALMSAMGLIRVLVSFAVFAIALVVVLDNLGVNVTGLVAGLGVGGIAIGLAAQGIFADLFAALAIIFDRPFRRGDSISYDTSSGTVEEIGLKSTRLRATNGEELIIANRKLLDKEIRNNARRPFRRTTFTLGLAYETPLEKLDGFPALVKGVVEAAGLTYIRCGFMGFGASTLDFDIEFDSESADYAAAYEGRHKVGIGLLRMCAEQGISIPYPTQTTLTAAPDGKLIMPYPDSPEPA
ncbi:MULTISPECIES: mechanosensitive ion channel domain-containing protein [unclassified Sphingomonas]|uniref:mechanosensitive ion channel family protein n=1 Tax=unclassified Sphingomonas TaxID=196159 RepID=UPI00092B4F82|nr:MULTISPECIES: mechanosensitive ion channel domain-containing protein [unclassified Sphingomonas]MBN8847577.1 mechanosensitive ion channel [Sphingomonas sp.]MBS0282927.1 mechanosensitive ion channel [Pseudomonadota bacterium]OJV32942.1 MAG: mechanosensitive ion channel protein MscS [Sphingomonas sp. 67-36]